MSIEKSYTFSNNTVAVPSEVNQNFDDLIAAIRAAHHRDDDGTPISYQDIADGWGLVPQYGIMMFAGLISAIPTGYVFCNGSNDTPDLRNKFVLCAGQDSGGTYDTGDTGGEETHVLTTDEMPSHSHGVNDPTHRHQNISGSGTTSSGYLADTNNGVPSSYSAYAATGITIQNAGGGAAHNNMPPFKALVFIMKS